MALSGLIISRSIILFELLSRKFLQVTIEKHESHFVLVRNGFRVFYIKVLTC
jgi:hypothetical protein